MIAAVAVAIGFKMNLFNIGVEGQFLMGAFRAAVAGAYVQAAARCCTSCSASSSR